MNSPRNFLESQRGFSGNKHHDKEDGDEQILVENEGIGSK